MSKVNEDNEHHNQLGFHLNTYSMISARYIYRLILFCHLCNSYFLYENI